MPGRLRQNGQSTHIASSHALRLPDQPCRGNSTLPRSMCVGCTGPGRKSDFRSVLQQIVVIRTKPTYKIQHVGVTPHPRREPLETAHGLNRVWVFSLTANVSIETIGIREIGFDCNRREAFFGDQSLSYLSPIPIEFVGPVGCFSDQDKTCFTYKIDERIVIRYFTGT